MGTVIKTFFWGVAIVTGLAVGDILSEELKDQYKQRKKKNSLDEKCSEQAATYIDD
jgi:hypothetical protein